MHYLYRLFDKDGSLLYIGVSANPTDRMRVHKTGSSWFNNVARLDVEKVGTKADALNKERRAIIQERPKHNKTKKIPGRQVGSQDEYLKPWRKRAEMIMAMLDRGQSQSDIARHFDVSRQAISVIVQREQKYRQVGAVDWVQRTRKEYLASFEKTRERAIRMHASGKTHKQIANALGKNLSSIYSMIKRGMT